MNLTTALNKVKTLKGKLARVSQAVNRSIILTENVAPDYVFLEVEEERLNLVNQLRDLKGKIQHTNQITAVEFDGKSCTLAELLLLNADLRSELAILQSRVSLDLEPNRFASLHGAEAPAKSYAVGFSKAGLETKIDELNERKSEVDALIGYTNARTTLSE